jgi:heme a synthase
MKVQPTYRHAFAYPFIRWWLWILAALVLVMVLIGGATRLTDYGRSITEWQPLLGAIPPLNEAQWLAAFEKYKAIPEYRIVNQGMTLAEFKYIYWWEWAHRFLGRFIGLALLVPFAVLWATRRLERGMTYTLLAVLVLGGFQAALGWYMVQSGLVDEPRVSQYRLATHLGLALIIYGAMFWVALRCLWPSAGGAPGTAARGARAFLVVLIVTVVSGAFVAGLRAGYIYNTFPLMAGYVLPPGLDWNPFDNPVTSQFVHRVLGVATFALALGLFMWSLARPFGARVRAAFGALAAAATLQAVLGVSTLLMQVPVLLGTLHQGGAVVVLTAALAALHLTRR